jgi:multidrug efflux pump subunit AcrA (membrane-fusion protein)
MLFSGCGRKGDADAAAAAKGPMPVQVQTIKTVTIPDTAEYLSVMKSRHSADIKPQVEGQITKIFVKSGDRVKAGQQLLQIDPLLRAPRKKRTCSWPKFPTNERSGFPKPA